MPFYYDVNKTAGHTTNGTTLTESLALWVKTAAVYDAAIKGVYATARSGSAGGASLRVKYNTGTTASGGTGITPGPRNLRGPVATTVWATDATTITAGTTLTTRLSVGFAQTGGQGGWVPLEAAGSLYMGGNALTPVDAEISSIAVGLSIPYDMTIEISEGGG